MEHTAPIANVPAETSNIGGSENTIAIAINPAPISKNVNPVALR